MSKRIGNNGNHGAKGRSGRKPTAITLLKRQLIENGKEDAEYAYSLFVTIMRNEEQPLSLRIECADWIANRVLGKPKLDMGVTGALTVDDVSKLGPDERRKRIAELLERRERAGIASAPGGGSASQ